MLNECIIYHDIYHNGVLFDYTITENWQHNVVKKVGLQVEALFFLSLHYKYKTYTIYYILYTIHLQYIHLL
jgi:hypothetical protein